MPRPVKKLFDVNVHTDGCTVISKPYKWLTGKYLEQRHSCIKHDEAYHYGGTHGQRLDADNDLRSCVCGCGDNGFEKSCFFVVGWLMYYAVRIGGSPKLPTPWRWRNNVSFELEDIKSGYKDTPVDYEELRARDAEILEQTGDLFTE